MTSSVALVLGVVSLWGCLSPEQAAATRARTELDCNDVIEVRQRTDLSVHTYEVTGCGKRVRYWCRYERGSAQAACSPEPAPTIEAAEPRGE